MCSHRIEKMRLRRAIRAPPPSQKVRSSGCQSVIHRPGRPDTTVIAVQLTDSHALITGQETLRYSLNSPVAVIRPTFKGGTP